MIKIDEIDNFALRRPSINTAAGELKTKNLENLSVMLNCCFKEAIWSLGKE